MKITIGYGSPIGTVIQTLSTERRIAAFGVAVPATRKIQNGSHRNMTTTTKKNATSTDSKVFDPESVEGVDLDSLIGLHVLDAVDTDTTKVKKWSDSFEDANMIRFRLDGKVYTAVEDPSDGYRSSMEKLFVSGAAMKNTFLGCKVLARKKGRSDYHENDTLEFIDVVTGKVVLEVGTDNHDDYYPCFVSSFMPENMAVNK